MLSMMLPLAGVTTSCNGNPPAAIGRNAPSEAEKNDMKRNRIRISIGAKTYTGTLADNPAASAFRAMLPLSLEMRDLHGNEKFFNLPSSLPTNDENPGNIRTGDLMLWSSRTVVIFYKPFPTPYSYTKLGNIENPEGLLTAVGAKDVMIKFEVE